MVDFNRMRHSLKTPNQTLVALDTEATGLTLRHGCRPFFVSTCDENGSLRYWKWRVNPKTRMPIIPKADVKQIQEMVDDPQHRFVMHNSKFDVLALESIGIKWNAWDRFEDTLVASHCLVSNESHGLKDLGIQYLDFDDDDESELDDAVKQARTKVRSLGWMLSKKQLPGFWPWMKTGKWAKADLWVPAEAAYHLSLPKKHPWYTLLDKYAIADAERTIALWLMFRDALQDEKLSSQYKKRRDLLPILYRMESKGITIKTPRMKELEEEFLDIAKTHQKICHKLSPVKIENLDSSKQLQKVLFTREGFNLTPTKPTAKSTEDNPNFSTSAEDLEPYLKKLGKRTRAWHFINSLFMSRRNNKGADYLWSYQLMGKKTEFEDFLRLHSVVNETGTGTTRFSSQNPNSQNVGKKELRDDRGNLIQSFNLRRAFSPMPGYEWFANDYNNIEMRIFAECSGDKRLIKAFEDGYSVHMIFAELLYPKEFKECLRTGEDFKKKYKSTLYQWVKNGNFSLIYGAGRTKADKTYHVDGAYNLIRKRMPEIDRFMRSKHEEATTQGYVTCLGGYRLMVPSDGPHKAVNYFVQGSAGWAMMLAMLRIDPYLQEIGNGYQMIMTIHDELDIEMVQHKRNMEVAKKCKMLMEQSGNDLGLALPVEVNRITDNWASEELVFEATAA